jgi:hypothetical protein
MYHQASDLFLESRGLEMMSGQVDGYLNQSTFAAEICFPGSAELAFPAL